MPIKKANELNRIETALPYCLFNVDSRFFKLNDEYQTKIRFIKIKTVPNRRTQDSKNIDTIRDRWGIDAHSQALILTEKEFDDFKKAKEFALKIINVFVRIYKYYNRSEIHLVNLNSEDLFGFNYISKNNFSLEVGLAGGIKLSNPLLNFSISNQIEDALVKKFELPFWDELLMDSQQYIYQTDFRHSILETIIALELVISDFIKKKCIIKSISENDAKEYIKNVGLTGNIKTTIRLLIDGNLPKDEIFEKCKAGITIRNHIVHDGKKDVNKNEAFETLNASRELIKVLINA